MEVGPREVYEKQFQDAWRGYNQEEVDDFLDRVAEALDSTHRENADLAERVRALEESVSTAREAEEMLRTTLVTAQQAAEEAMSKARAKADQLVAEAQQLVDEAEERLRASADEAQERRSSLEADLRRRAREAERDQEQRQRELEQSIERLAAFESELKRKLQDFFDRQQQALTSLASASAPSQGQGQADHPEQSSSSDAVVIGDSAGKSPPTEGATQEEDVLADTRFPDFEPSGDSAVEPEYEHQRRGFRSLFHRDEE